MDRKWSEVFRQILGKTERSLVNELLAVRNSWAHQETFSSDDAYRALDSAEVGLVVVQGVDRTAQQVHRVDRLIPDVGGRRSGIPQHVFVLLQLRRYGSICCSVCTTLSMAVITFCVSLPTSITVIPTACAGAIIAGPVERAIARKILAAKILVSRFIVFSSWRHQ
jgi:hypothetical protein